MKTPQILELICSFVDCSSIILLSCLIAVCFGVFLIASNDFLARVVDLIAKPYCFASVLQLLGEIVAISL